MKHFNFCKDTLVPLHTISWGGISSGFPTKLKPDSDVRSPVKIWEKNLNDITRFILRIAVAVYKTIFRMIV